MGLATWAEYLSANLVVRVDGDGEVGDIMFAWLGEKLKGVETEGAPKMG